MTDQDRTVHVQIVPPTGGPMIEIVRYDRGGKWFYESGPTRKQLTLDEAVRFAENRSAVIWFEGRSGGRTFDAKVRQMRLEKSR